MESDSFVLVHLEASDDDAPALDSIVGVSGASNADQVVVTFARQGAKVLEVHDGQELNSWAVRPDTNLVLPTIQVPGSQSLFGFVAPASKHTTSKHTTKPLDISLLSWGAQDEDITRAKLKKLDIEVAAVLPISQVDARKATSELAELLIVSRSGSLTLYTRSLQPIKSLALLHDTAAASASRVVWANMIELDEPLADDNDDDDGHDDGEDTRQVSAVFMENGSKTSGSLYVVSVTQSRKGAWLMSPVAEFTITKLPKKSTIVSTVYEPRSNVLALICSDNTLRVYTLPALRKMHKNQHLRFTIDSSPTTHELSALSQDASKARVISFGSATLVVLSFGKRAGDSEARWLLSSWSMAFGTLLGTTVVNVGDATTPRALQLKNITKSIDESHVLIAFDTVVSVCSLYADGGSLAASLGKLASESSKQSSYMSAFSLDELLHSVVLAQPVADMEIEQQQQEQRDSNHKAAPQGVAIEQQAPFQTVDEATWHTVESRHQTALKDEEKRLLKRLRAATATDSQVPAVPELLLKCLVHSLLAKSQWSDLLLVVRTGFVSAVTFPHLLESVVKSQNLELLHACFEHISDIPELQLVKTLAAVLSRPPQAICEYSQQHNLPPSLFLRLAYAQRVSDLVLVRALKSIPIDTIIILLHFSSLALREINGVVPQQPLLPTYAQVITWTSALLDAHLTKLLLIEEYQPLLAELRQEVAAHVNTCRALAQLDGVLSHVRLQLSMPVSATEQYAVENLNF